jgi:outer membrane receptor protein involved in Fe transport
MLACLGASALAQDEAAKATLPDVQVIQRTPLPGFETSSSLYPGNVQQASDLDIEAAGAGTLPEFMNRKLLGVTVNEVQGDPYQVDLNYRGQRLSPVLGSAQGLSLWLDGVRMNQPFGDTVQWDLLPQAAIAGVLLVPGSNPLYGLNTLAGALVLTTKSGLSDPGTELDVSAGSWGRKRIDFAQGQHWQDGWHAFVAASAFDEGGWRDRSPGRLGNIFFKAGRQEGADGWSVSMLDAGSRLDGNGLLNESLAAHDWGAVYTAPDTTRNHESLFTARTTRSLDRDTRLALQAWYREDHRATRNGDVNDDWGAWLADCAGEPAAARCTDRANPGFVSQQAVINSTQSRQQEAGAGAQWTRKTGRHELTAGADFAFARIAHDQFSQAATFDAQRNAIPLGAAPTVQDVALRARTSLVGLFASDAYRLGPATQLTASARWAATTVRNQLGQPEPLQGESFRYGKLNPALGLTHSWSDRLVLFASASQSSRAPTALELGCADATRPCVLPTGLQSDPFLEQVVARTIEAGARTRGLRDLQLSAAAFQTVNRNDIVFVRSGVSQAGYFSNVGRTRRRGLELAAEGRSHHLDWQASATWLDATYGSSLVLPGPLSTPDQPDAVQPGTRIAGLPEHVLKLSAQWHFRPHWTIATDLQAVSSQVTAGNESGTRPELGRLPGYAVVHARLHWRPRERWAFTLGIDNVFDRRYATYAAGNIDLFPGGVALQPGPTPSAARFVAPAAPRSVLVSARYVWD